MSNPKMDEDNQSVDSPAQSNPGTPLPSNPGTPRNDRIEDIALVTSTSCYPTPQTSASGSRSQPKPKYSQLLAIIEELGKDIRPTYAGSRSSAERLKRGIVHAQKCKQIFVHNYGYYMVPEKEKKWLIGHYKSTSSPLDAFRQQNIEEDRSNYKELDDFNNDKVHFMATDTTKYYADSVEWCPFENLSNFFVCGTYQLDEESSSECQVRHGNLVLYKLVQNQDGSGEATCSTPAFQLSIVDSVPTSGILDMKWCSHLLHSKIVISLVCSDGQILLKCLNESEADISLSDLTFHDVAEEENKMVLSVDWSGQNENSASIVASDTKGFLNYFKLREADLSLLNSWKAHDFESWISAFNYSDPNIIYSGGDDCCFKSWDVRNLTSSIFVKKRHSMGVTAISKSKLDENLLITGSYDENIFLWDVRNMNSTLSEISVHGGVWRLKWHPTNPTYLLSAAMHNGFQVLSHNSNQLELELSYDRHKSLAYGVDWCHIPPTSSNFDKNQDLLRDCDKYNIKNIIASCSFYDNLLHVWGINF